jgi:hypothetical protein
MYRLRRRRKLQRRRRASVVAAFIAVVALVIGVPTLASANGVDTLLNGLSGGGGSGGDTASPSPESGTPPSYVPPLHGTNAHGQGTDAVVDLTPSNTNPYPATPADSGEEIAAGDSRGDQVNNQYSGTVTPLWLFGTPIGQIHTDQNSPHADGPFQGINDALTQICNGSGGQICLTVLDYHSDTNSSGSNNTFTGVGANLLGVVGADVLSSQGDISDNGTCQTAHGHSRVVGVGLGAPIGDTANVAEGDSSSTACNDGSQPTVQQSSSVIGLGGQGIGIPAAGCADGTENTNFTPLAPLVTAVCNANDQNAGQTSSPYGVREALTAFVLDLMGTPLIKATTAGPESHAVAPPKAQTPTTCPPTCPTTPGGNKGGNKKGGGGGNQGGGAGGGGGAGAAAGAAAAGGGQLAFTGADLLALGLVGGALILGGLALTTTAGRRHRRTV